jgi:hypothetical protein
LVPFQCSASIFPPKPVTANPTAVQDERVGHDTPASPIPPAGLGIGWTAQLVPFQRSARFFIEAVFPTAVQADAEVHETATRASPVLAEVGAVWALHLVPFQPSVIVPVGLPELSTAMPTAMQALADGHETPVRNPN